jgi:hypothetical protein
MNERLLANVAIAGLVDTAAGIAAKQFRPSADARKQKSGAQRHS